jgi:hypothetical protein
MAIVVTAVVAQFGAYYKPGSDNAKTLRSVLYNGIETAQYFQERPTEDTIWRGNLASMGRVIQPFQKTYTPIADITFTPNSFSLFKLKIDQSVQPDDIEPTYLGFLADKDTADRKQWPLIRYIIEEHLKLKRDEDLEQNEYFDGEFVAPVDGVAGAAGTAMDGIRKVIAGYNTAGRTNLGNGAIAMGAIAADEKDFCTQVEEFVEAIPKAFRKKIKYVFMNDELYLRYKKGKEAKYNMNNTLDANLETIKLFPNITVVGLLSHGESELIWTSIPVNMIRPVKKQKAGQEFEVEGAKRTVDIYTDWWEALNFEVPEFIFHNEHDLD